MTTQLELSLSLRLFIRRPAKMNQLPKSSLFSVVLPLFRHSIKNSIVPGYFTLLVTRLHLPYTKEVRLHVH